MTTDEWIKKLRQLLITTGGFTWKDSETGVKWHLTVTKREEIKDDEEFSKDKEPSKKVKSDGALSKWLKND